VAQGHNAAHIHTQHALKTLQASIPHTHNTSHTHRSIPSEPQPFPRQSHTPRARSVACTRLRLSVSQFLYLSLRNDLHVFPSPQILGLPSTQSKPSGSLPARVAAVILRNTLFHNIVFTLETSGLVAAVAHRGRRTRRRRRLRNWGIRQASPYPINIFPCFIVSLNMVALCLVLGLHTAFSGGTPL
jgi:hypothetical protein